MGRSHHACHRIDLLVGTQHQAVFKTRNSPKQSEKDFVFSPLPGMLIEETWGKIIKMPDTNCNVNISSGFSASRSMWPIPCSIKACTLHNACMVLPKCLPWWTRGLVVRLQGMVDVSCMVRQNKQLMTFFGDPAAKHPLLVMVVYHTIVQLVADFLEKPLLRDGLEMKLFCKWNGRSGLRKLDLGHRLYNFLRWCCVCLLFVAGDIFH